MLIGDELYPAVPDLLHSAVDIKIKQASSSSRHKKLDHAFLKYGELEFSSFWWIQIKIALEDFLSGSLFI